MTMLKFNMNKDDMPDPDHLNYYQFEIQFNDSEIKITINNKLIIQKGDW